MYPAWRYHAEKMPEGIIVHSEGQDKSLGAGWVDEPAKFGKAELKAELKAESKKKSKKDAAE